LKTENKYKSELKILINTVNKSTDTDTKKVPVFMNRPDCVSPQIAFLECDLFFI